MLAATIELRDLFRKKKKKYINRSLNRPLSKTLKDECFFKFFAFLFTLSEGPPRSETMRPTPFQAERKVESAKAPPPLAHAFGNSLLATTSFFFFRPVGL